MGNMSYCRMENTHRDLQDVAEHINDENLSKTEKKYRDRIIELCETILEDSGRLDELIDQATE